MRNKIFRDLHNLQIMSFPFENKIYDGIIKNTKPEEHPFHIQYNFETSKAFLNAIEYDSKIYKRNEFSFDNYDFVYRGHSNHKWKLLPSGYRDNIFDSFQKSTKLVESEINFKIWDKISKLEKFSFVKFIIEIDKLGIPIDRNLLNFAITEYRGYRYGYHPLSIERVIWLRDEYLEILGLAQHYGINTRLLDFTKNPYVAAFFAAADCFEKSEYQIILDLKEIVNIDLKVIDLKTKLNAEEENIIFTQTPIRSQKIEHLLKTKYLKIRNGKYILTKKGKDILEYKIGVWLLPQISIFAAEKIGRLKYIQIPKKYNANLKAQDGVFLTHLSSLFPYSIDYINSGKNNKKNTGAIFPPHENEINQFNLKKLHNESWKLKSINEFILENNDDEIIENIKLTTDKIKNQDVTTNPYRNIQNRCGKPRLFTLPWTEVNDLIRKLEMINITWTTIMPSLEGARKQSEFNKRLLF